MKVYQTRVAQILSYESLNHAESHDWQTRLCPCFGFLKSVGIGGVLCSLIEDVFQEVTHVTPELFFFVTALCCTRVIPLKRQHCLPKQEKILRGNTLALGTSGTLTGPCIYMHLLTLCVHASMGFTPYILANPHVALGRGSSATTPFGNHPEAAMTIVDWRSNSSTVLRPYLTVGDAGICPLRRFVMNLEAVYHEGVGRE